MLNVGERVEREDWYKFLRYWKRKKKNISCQRLMMDRENFHRIKNTFILFFFLTKLMQNKSL